MPAFGRGGAGNIEAATTATTSTNDKISSDLESQQQSAESYAGTAHPALQNQEYAHMGRGGAGNYYSPRVLKETGLFEGAESSHVLGDGTPVPGKEGGVSVGGGGAVGGGKNYYGRGGAGNYGGGVEEFLGKEEDEERRKEELMRQIQRGVEESLPRPEKARLVPGGEPY